MGQALITLSPDEFLRLVSFLDKEIRRMILAEQRNEEKMAKEIEPLLDNWYETHFRGTNRRWASAAFYRAICETVEEINKKLGSTQLRVPSMEKLQEAYEEHNLGGGRKLTEEELRQVLEEVVIGAGFTGASGAGDFFFYIFCIPAASLFLKSRLSSARFIPNDFFIPAVTSATVYLLAKLNKI